MFNNRSRNLSQYYLLGSLHSKKWNICRNIWKADAKYEHKVGALFKYQVLTPIIVSSSAIEIEQWVFSPGSTRSLTAAKYLRSTQPKKGDTKACSAKF
ncbi:hypothetical protein TNCV_2244741 [Trichonephila clavipes]|nr:hypothetical protein TNCV_2244741 [Trichonephila clavipes]